MNKTNMCEHIGEKLSGYLDEELTQQESQMVRVHIQGCSRCAAAYNELKAIQKAIDETEYPNLEDEKMRKVLNDETSNRIHDVAWTALLSAISVIVIFILFSFFASSETPVFIKLIFSLIVGGVGGLFVLVLRQRLIIRKTDRYKKVDL